MMTLEIDKAIADVKQTLNVLASKPATKWQYSEVNNFIQATKPFIRLREEYTVSPTRDNPVKQSPITPE